MRRQRRGAAALVACSARTLPAAGPRHPPAPTAPTASHPAQVALPNMASIRIAAVSATSVAPGGSVSFNATGSCPTAVGPCATRWLLDCNTTAVDYDSPVSGGNDDNVTITTGPRGMSAVVRVSASSGEQTCTVTVNRTDAYGRSVTDSANFTVRRGLAGRRGLGARARGWG